MVMRDARFIREIKCRIAIECEMEGTSRRGRSREQLPDDPKKRDHHHHHHHHHKHPGLDPLIRSVSRAIAALANVF